LTLQCVDPIDCPAGYFVDKINKLCVTRCNPPYWGDSHTKVCVAYCLWNPPTYVSYY